MTSLIRVELCSLVANRHFDENYSAGLKVYKYRIFFKYYIQLKYYIDVLKRVFDGSFNILLFGKNSRWYSSVVLSSFKEYFEGESNNSRAVNSVNGSQVA